jgi:hypothetical protein
MSPLHVLAPMLTSVICLIVCLPSVSCQRPPTPCYTGSGGRGFCLARSALRRGRRLGVDLECSRDAVPGIDGRGFWLRRNAIVCALRLREDLLFDSLRCEFTTAEAVRGSVSPDSPCFTDSWSASQATGRYLFPGILHQSHIVFHKQRTSS